MRLKNQGGKITLYFSSGAGISRHIQKLLILPDI
jgi:hypothetical protein